MKSPSSRQTELHAQAIAWIAANPVGFERLLTQAQAKTIKKETFSIRELCERLRWEQTQALNKGPDGHAISNSLTRYIGIEVMRRFPDSQQFMTTRMPKTEREELSLNSRERIAARAQTLTLAHDAVQVFGGAEPMLAWCVDLELLDRDLTLDEWERLLKRLKSALTDADPTTLWGPELPLVVSLSYGGIEAIHDIGWVGWLGLAILPPPYGRWMLRAKWVYAD